MFLTPNFYPTNSCLHINYSWMWKFAAAKGYILFIVTVMRSILICVTMKILWILSKVIIT